jgi:hypothetical protein
MSAAGTIVGQVRQERVQQGLPAVTAEGRGGIVVAQYPWEAARDIGAPPTCLPIQPLFASLCSGPVSSRVDAGFRRRMRDLRPCA